jgi:hypothetical protein
MEKLSFQFSIFVILSNFVFLVAQDSTRTMDGFLGVKFGASASSVKKNISARSEAKFDSKYSKQDVLIFDRVRIAGKETRFVKFEFFKDQLYGIVAYYKASLDARTIELYDEIKSDINSKYYYTDADYKSFKYPYEAGDGHEITAITLGKASIVAKWTFAQSDGTENQIYLDIDDNLNIKLFYNCGRISAQASETQKSKESTDY